MPGQLAPAPAAVDRRARAGGLRRRAAALALAAALTLTAAPAAPDAAPRRSVSYTMYTMGTYAQVLLVTADSAAAAPLVRRAMAQFTRLDSLMSNWTTSSEVARLNRVAASTTAVVQPEVARVIDTSMRIWKQSDGAFDITVEPLVRAWGFLGGPRHVPPDSVQRAAAALVGGQWLTFDPAARTLHFQRPGMRIDLGGIAKGYAVDVVADSLARAGVKDALVNLSGNMRALGTPADDDHWRIGVRDPRDRMPFFAVVDLRPGEGISTSAKYEQFVAQDGKTYGHIMDPRSGRPAEGLIAVTLVCPNAFISDGWDTPLFVLGLDAAKRKLRALPGISAILVQPGSAGVDTVWVAAALRDRFALVRSAEPLFRVKFFE